MKIFIDIGFLYYHRLSNSKVSRLWKAAFHIVLAIRSKIIISQYSKENTIYRVQDNYADKLCYGVNCSGFINDLLSLNFKKHLDEIRRYIIETDDRKGYRDGNPRVLQYLRFIQSNKTKKYWQRITDARTLKSGDLLLFAHNTEKVTPSGQHIMIVSDNIQPNRNRGWINVPIIDSTNGHGKRDKEIRGEKGGIEESIVCLKVNDNGIPQRSKWSPDSLPKRPTIVMARIKD